MLKDWVVVCWDMENSCVVNKGWEAPDAVCLLKVHRYIYPSLLVLEIKEVQDA